MKLRALFAAACMVCLSGCLIGDAVHLSNPKVTGTMSLTSSDSKVTKFTPDGCQSGDHEDFLGFDFFSSTGKMQLRAVFQPLEGPVVRIRSHEEDEFADVILRKADCRIFDPTINQTNWTINDSRDFTVRIALDCKTPKGARIEGALATDHCH